MYLVDYHVHSKNSFDGEEDIKDLIVSAVKAGIKEICITDHFEGYEEIKPKHEFLFEKSKEDILDIKDEFINKIKILYGVEFGQIHFEQKLCEDIIKRNDFDFIIGSVHNIKNDKDLFYVDYSNEDPNLIFKQYLIEVNKTIKTDCFDVLGHLTYPVRYMKRDGVDIKLNNFYDEIKEILKIIIEKGKGIEINVSGLRHIMNEPMPNIAILKLYKSLGGEIITIGSDAHRSIHVGVLIKEGYEILKESGFSYITVFEKRKPEFIKL